MIAGVIVDGVDQRGCVVRLTKQDVVIKPAAITFTGLHRKRWIVNGVECEISELWPVVQMIAMAIETLNLTDKKLLVWSSPVMSRDSVLELLDPDELPERLSERTCMVIGLNNNRILREKPCQT